MSSGSQNRFVDHVTLAGDCMVLVVPVVLLLALPIASFIRELGQPAIGFLVGVALAPAATLSAVWLFRGKTPEGDTKATVGLATLVVTVAAVVGYGFVASQGLDLTGYYSTMAAVALGIDAVLAAFLVLDSVTDLAKRRAHITLDVLRLTGTAFILAALVLFWTNPSMAQLIAAIASLALAGGIAGAIGDAISTIESRFATSASGNAHTAAS